MARRKKTRWPKLEQWLVTLAESEGRSNRLAARFRDLLLREGSRRLLAARGFSPPQRAALFARGGSDSNVDSAALDELLAELELGSLDLPHALGGLFEALASFEVQWQKEVPTLAQTRRRKKTGMFYTPGAVGKEVAERALAALSDDVRRGAFTICDPACGSGAFLIEAARALVGADSSVEQRRQAVSRLVGVDLDAHAIEVAELALWAFVADGAWDGAGLRLHVADALMTEVSASGWGRIVGEGVDLVIGNPPWVAFAGRAAQPLDSAKKAHYLRNFEAFRGYPTLHALFVERALELAPRGVVALLVPSPLADLDGYRALRRRLLATHEPCEPMLEFGQDAFETVTQPCFALIAKPRSQRAPEGERRLRLAERERLGGVAKTVEPPEVLLRFAEREAFPAELFGELGFQSNRVVSTQLFLRAEAARAPFTYPLLEGREVSEFSVGEPRLFLHPDEGVLHRTRCRLRLLDDYRRVQFVVRQTAKFPIAALHSGLPFRNTLLAGFDVSDLAPELVVGLLNSSLYRALHLARQRDARQKVFPQVKIAHLRALPRPPRDSDALCQRVRELTRDAKNRAQNELRRALDHAVFELFGLSASEREQVLGFAAERAPELSVD